MKMRPIIVSGLLVLVVAGCSSPAGDSTDTAQATVVRNCGLELTFDDPPERAITLEQNATEILLSLGLADRMAGSAYKIAPPLPELESDFNSVPLLSEQSLSAEALREALPDFTYSTLGSFYSTDGVGTREELLDLGVPSYVSETACPDGDAASASFSGLFAEYRSLGSIFGVEDAAESLIATQQQVLDAAGSDHPVEPPTIAWFYSTYNGVPIVAGAGGMPSAISEAVGARNVFDDVTASTWPEMSWEQVAQRDPDILVIADLSSRGKPGDSAADKRHLLESDPVASQLTAVKNGNVVAISGTEMDPSVRSVHAVDTLHTWLQESGVNR
jgi:iron complex transport system substrate-binding protein